MWFGQFLYWPLAFPHQAYISQALAPYERTGAHQECTRVVLGIVVREEDLGNKNPSARVIVTNHVTWCDHVAVHIATGCVT
ncbi:unnamed protein product, partial [Timema podura]|nr:unnamed protein product [Timema podura]